MADVLIAVEMTLLLRRASGKFSNFVLIRVIRLTVETNTLTACAAVATLVLYVAFPNEQYFRVPVRSITWETVSDTLYPIVLHHRLKRGSRHHTIVASFCRT
ncbi:hypothetical protein BJY52DRAFT_1301340 [Lactarius psammicola]|nr:hypothetical protein BJY52DRAFT_1301340 [Lactarius psammicola]